MAIELATDDIDTQLAEMERQARVLYQQTHHAEFGPWEIIPGQFVVCRVREATLRSCSVGPRCTWLVNWRCVGRNELRGILRRAWGY